MNECLLPVSMTPAISCSRVSTTPAINPCHEFSVIAGDNDTGEQLSPVTTTPAINILPVTTTPVIRVYGVPMDACFHGGSNETIGRCV